MKTKQDPLKCLKCLVADLQNRIEKNEFNQDKIKEATETLSKLGYQYDHKLFPKLPDDTSQLIFTESGVPSNLAEALLWKLGRWNDYKQFSSYYSSKKTNGKKTDVIFFAFAKHLKDKKNPIYDQHAIRALFAVSWKKLNDDEKNQLKSLLFYTRGEKKDKWKPYSNGKHTIDCYELFVKYVNEYTDREGGATKKELDELLMPLGKAIKKKTKTFVEFSKLCN